MDNSTIYLLPNANTLDGSEFVELDQLITGVRTSVKIPVSTIVSLAGGITTVKVSLTSAQILALGNTPIVLVAAPGTGKVIKPLSVLYKYNYGTATYLTNTTLLGSYSGVSGNVISTNSIINQTQNSFSASVPQANTPLDADVSNLALVISTSSNPTAGDGTLDIYITYTAILL